MHSRCTTGVSLSKINITNSYVTLFKYFNILTISFKNLILKIIVREAISQLVYCYKIVQYLNINISNNKKVTDIFDFYSNPTTLGYNLYLHVK